MSYFAIKAIALLAFLMLSACQGASDEVRDGYLSVAEISENFSRLQGTTVSVRNDIQEQLSDRVFLLDKDRLLDGEPILVVNVSDMPLILAEGEETEVWVRGEVVEFVRSDIEREYNLDLDTNVYAEYENRAAVIARSVILSPDPSDITSNPEAYYGKLLVVEGEVDDPKTSKIFELDEEQVFGGEDLLVINPNPEIELKDEQNVLVTGTLRPFIVVEFDRDYDLDWDLSLQQQLEAEFERKPALLVDKVELVTQ